MTSKPDYSQVGKDIVYDTFLDCVHCGLCTSACPTYLETGDENNSPRGRIYLMRAVTDGRLELTEKVSGHLDLCLDCRSCETACPSGVQYGRLIEPFRHQMQEADNKVGNERATGWFEKLILYRMFPYAKRLKWALFPAYLMQLVGLDRLMEKSGMLKLLPTPLQRMQSLLPKLKSAPPALPLVLPAKGEKRARVALFTGCVGEALFSDVNWATARVLQENGCEVVIPREQTCCGAIHYHSGSGAPAMEFAKKNISVFEDEKIDRVIVNIAGCGAMLKEYNHIAEDMGADDKTREEFDRFAHKVSDIAEFLEELGPVPPQGALETTVVYHDACHLAHAQSIRQQPRSLLSMIPSLKLVPLDESEVCCGAAGSYNLTQGEMADQLGKRKIEHILKTEASLVAVGNAGCSLQIQSFLKKENAGIPVVHPIQLLDLSYRNAGLEEL